jgi:hypothetical protein
VFPLQFVRAPRINNSATRQFVVLRPSTRSRAFFSLPRALSLQLRVLGLGLLKNGDIGIRVLPQRQKIPVGCERPDAGSIGIRALRTSRLQRIGTSHAQMRQRSRPAIPDNTAVIENLVKFGGSSNALSRRQACLSPRVRWIETGNIGGEPDLP